MWLMADIENDGKFFFYFSIIIHTTDKSTKILWWNLKREQGAVKKQHGQSVGYGVEVEIVK